MKKKARVIQICGTGSGVGKSVIVAGLCRIFQQKGYRVAPFKAQNMALNSAVTADGGEIGRAQAMQAAACKIKPTVDMNPILLKPTSHIGSQVIVHGRPIGNMTAVEYYKYKTQIFDKVTASVKHLMNEYDLVIIEGAGSPAEINLKKHDIVNMRIARFLNAPVVLVGDIDCGGVFAWLLGTLMLLTKKEQSLVCGFIINKFRGDKTLLASGLQYLEKKSKKKVFGVVPYYTNIKLPEEDSMFFNQYKLQKKTKRKCIKIAVIKLPHISNFTDFDVLTEQDDVELSYTIDIKILASADCIIIPGSKNTIHDLQFLFNTEIADVIKKRAKENCLIVGICGGFQMLGKYVIEKEKQIGLELLDVSTYFEHNKSTFQVVAKHIETQKQLQGYEIHHGKTIRHEGCKPMFKIISRNEKKSCIYDGAQNKFGNVWGTYIHGVFDNIEFRTDFLNNLREAKGMKKCIDTKEQIVLDHEFDMLAELLRDNLDLEAIEQVMYK